MNKAIYAFSGDPITIGHINIIERALNVFDHLIVGIGVNPKKKYLFSLEDRTEMAKKVLSKYKNISVVPFQGLLVDYAYENNIATIIRGVRNSEDFNYEILLSQLNDSQKHGIDTFFLPALKKYIHISSGAVKALQLEQGIIDEFVPLYIKQKLEEKLSKQYILGVSGEIGSGKSYISKKLVEFSKEKEIKITRIDIDTIGHEILGELTEPIYEKTRKIIIEKFGEEIILRENFINTRKLGQIIFNDLDKLIEFNSILYRPLILRLRRKMYDLEGIILLDSALILEADMSFLCNHNIVLVSVDKKTQLNRLRERNYTEKQIKNRFNSQYTYEKKYSLINYKIKTDNTGKLFEIENSKNGNHLEIKKLFNCILRYFKIDMNRDI